MIFTALKSPCHSVSIAFENCVCPSARKCFQYTSSAFRRLRLKFSMQWARLGRRNRKGSVFLGFLRRRYIVSPLFLLNVHRSFTFGRHPLSVSVALHRHSVVSRRSFIGHAQVESLSGWIIACSRCARLLELGRACFERMRKNNGFTGLCSSWRFPMRFHHRLPVDGVSGNLSLFSKSNPAITDSNLHVSAG